MKDDQAPGPILATTNRNSNLVLALWHRLPPGRDGHVWADGLKAFGVAMLFGIEPAVYLIAKAAADLPFAGTAKNDNFIFQGCSPEEFRRRLRAKLIQLGQIQPD